MTKTLYAATSRYVEEINNLPVKRQVSVSGILKKLDVSRSGYNAWKKRVPSDTSIRRTVLKEKIQKIYDDSHQNYGAPKIAAELRKSGETITEKTVGNYMRQMGIKAQWIKPYTQTTIDSDLSQKLKNILNEKFNPEHPDAVWCSDITYIWTYEGFVYLTSIMDLYSRKIISWVLLDIGPPEERLKERQSSIKTLLEEFFAWLRKIQTDQSVLPKGETAKGINYCLNQAEYLKVFLSDGEVPIDNLASERALRTFTIGRKNWMTINTVRGADASAIIYSVTETARANGLNVYYYMKHLLTELTQVVRADGSIDEKELEPLMPWSKDLPAECYKRRK